MTTTPPPLEPGEIELDRRLVVAGVLVVALIVGALLSFSSRPAGAPAPPSPTPVTTPTPETVSAVARTSVACPAGWKGFVNPIADFEICRPGSWRIVQEGEIRSDLELAELGDIRLVDARALPWDPGIDPIAVVQRAGSIDLQLLTDPPARVMTDRCSLDDRAGRFQRCTYRADAAGRPQPTGAFHVVVAELRPELPGDRRLVAIATVKAAAPERDRRLVERVLRTMRRVPDTALL